MTVLGAAALNTTINLILSAWAGSPTTGRNDSCFNHGGGIRMRKSIAILAATAALMLASGPASAAVPCRTSGPFDAWLAKFKQEAAAQGISQHAIAAAS